MKFLFVLKNDLKKSEEKVKTSSEKLSVYPMYFKNQSDICL